jgi:acetyl-CoA synthetase
VDQDSTDEATIRKSVIRSLVAEIGPIAKPDVIQIVPGLPKTRSGKIMRRILRKIAEGDTGNLGDTSTLLDPSVVEVLKADALALRK